MASQTLPLGSRSLLANTATNKQVRIFIGSQNSDQLIDSDLVAGGATANLVQVVIQAASASGYALILQTSATPNLSGAGGASSGPDLTDQFENNWEITFAQGTATWVFDHSEFSADPSEPYFWSTADAATRARLLAAFNGLRATQGGTVTLNDGLNPPSFADSTGDTITGEQGRTITPVVVPDAGGNPSPSYVVIGVLPDGLVFDAGTRTISGTPVEGGTGRIFVQAFNSQGFDNWVAEYNFRTTIQLLRWDLPGGISQNLDFQTEFIRPPETYNLDWDFSGEVRGDVLDFQLRRFLDLPAPALQPSSDQLRESAFEHETAEAWLVLLTISHDDLSEPIRVVNNETNIVSRGNTFVAFAFEPILPTDAPDRAPEARLRLDNVSRELIEHIRSIQSPPSVTFEVIRSTAPDVVEKSWTGFELRDVRWDAREINGRLAQRDILTEAYPADIFSPAQFRGLV